MAIDLFQFLTRDKWLAERAELERLREIEGRAKRCAGKLSVEYQRGTIRPRDEFDELLRIFGFEVR